MSQILKLICRSATIGLALLLLMMTLVINSVVVTRYFFAWSPSWSEELTRYAMVWLVMIGGGILAIFDDHIALTMCVENLRPGIRRLQSSLIQVVVTAIGILLTWKGWLFAIDGAFITAPGLQVSMVWVTFSVPVGGALVTLAGLVNLWNLATTPGSDWAIRMPIQKSYMHGSFKQPTDMEIDG